MVQQPKWRHDTCRQKGFVCISKNRNRPANQYQQPLAFGGNQSKKYISQRQWVEQIKQIPQVIMRTARHRSECVIYKRHRGKPTCLNPNRNRKHQIKTRPNKIQYEDFLPLADEQFQIAIRLFKHSSKWQFITKILSCTHCKKWNSHLTNYFNCKEVYCIVYIYEGIRMDSNHQ